MGNRAVCQVPRCHLPLPRRSRGRGLQLKINLPPPHPPAPAAYRVHPSTRPGGLQQNETWREHHLPFTPTLGGPTAPPGISTTPAGAESAPGWEEREVPASSCSTRLGFGRGPTCPVGFPRVLWGSHAAPAPAPLLPLAAGAEPAARAAGSPHGPGPELLLPPSRAGWLQPCGAAGDPGELPLHFPNDVAAPCAGTPRLLSFPFFSSLRRRPNPVPSVPLATSLLEASSSKKKTTKTTPYSFCSPLDLRRAPCRGREQPCSCS